MRRGDVNVARPPVGPDRALLSSPAAGLTTSRACEPTRTTVSQCEQPRRRTWLAGRPVTRILIVENEPPGAAAHLDWVACLPGFAVIGQTGSGAEALQWLAQNPVDLVLLDIDLPDMSGTNVLRIMRGRGYTMDVIAEMRGNRPDLLQAAFSYGVLYCLIKPTTFTMIQQGLERYAAYRSCLARCGDFVVQAEVDDLMASLREPDQARRLPKGICPESLNPIVAELSAADKGTGFSAA